MNPRILNVVKIAAAWMIASLVLAGIIFYAYYGIRSRMPGRVANVQIEIEASVIFSKEVIESAIDVAIKEFANSRDGWHELLEIRYCEGYSNAVVRNRNWDAGNSIVIIASYQRNSAPGSNRPSTTRRWEWVLFRDGSDYPWKVVAGGKTL